MRVNVAQVARVASLAFASSRGTAGFLAAVCVLSLRLPPLLLWRQMAPGGVGEAALAHVKMLRHASSTCACGCMGLGDGDLKLFDFASDVFFAHAKPLLQSPEQFIFLALGEGQIVVSQFSIFLL